MITPITSYTSKPFSSFSLAIPAIEKQKVSCDTLQETKNDFAWVSNPIIISALDELKHVEFDKNDIAYIKSMDIEPPFKSGADAVDFIKKSNLRIDFSDTGSDRIHAQYDFKENKIMLNKKYQNTSDTADILALSEAILHESCHAKDNDAGSSIQEELINLATGALAHRFYEKKYPSIFNNANTLIINEGVNLYAKLFFDEDKEKTALKKRVKLKYGLLPAGDKVHVASDLALKIKNSSNFN